MRLRKESSSSGFAEKASMSSTTLPRHKRKFQWQEVLRTLSDPKSYLTASMFFCLNVAFR
jgi:hypothetical protein